MADLLLSHPYVILLLPLLSFLAISLALARVGRGASAACSLACSFLAMLGGLLLAMGYYRQVLLQPALFPGQVFVPWQYEWLNFSPGLTANIGVLLDPISVMMVMVITVIAFLVNVYSVGYMREDPSFSRFFALLSLFAFSMLGLVVAPNILQMFVFWELVGVSSYALIGFWYEKPSAVAASKKAFIVTRFADAFFLLGIITVSFYAGSFDFAVLNTGTTAAALNKSLLLGSFTVNLLPVATLLIFAGGWGKSAMFPLHIWLPDAMEGPTPVSSIIHSATMVVAGVYLTARMFPLFAASPATLAVVQFVGTFTALFAAVIAITQKDIKRILAFSTLSQLGYMMFSLGVASMAHGHGGAINNLGYSASMFHVFTHAFFKCMLFLGAGAIIHAVHSNDIDVMGGLRGRMPRTYWAMLTACLAIAGIFPFAGFWSKDAILLAAFQSGHYVSFAIGLLVSALTAFYMFRFFFLIFSGEPRAPLHDVHEDPLMTWPIVILAVPSVVAGYLCKGFFDHYFLVPGVEAAGHGAHPAWLPWVATACGVLGIGLAFAIYGGGELALADRLRRKWAGIYQVVYDKFYIDELYLFITKKVIFRGIAAPIKWFDRTIVDGLMDLTGYLLQLVGSLVRFMQNGQVSFYLGATAAGLLLLYLFGRLPVPLFAAFGM